MSPEEFRQKFILHQKGFSASWHDFAFKLRKFFEEWVKGFEISKLEELKELMITNQIKQKFSLKMCKHFIDNLPAVKNTDVLVNKLDDYEAAC